MDLKTALAALDSGIGESTVRLASVCCPQLEVGNCRPPQTLGHGYVE